MSETASAGVAYPSAAVVLRSGVGLEPDVTGFYDEATGSVHYLVADPITRRCAIIDPVLDFDPTSDATRTTSADRLLRHIEAQGLILESISIRIRMQTIFSCRLSQGCARGAHHHRRAGDGGPENLEKTLQSARGLPDGWVWGSCR